MRGQTVLLHNVFPSAFVFLLAQRRFFNVFRCICNRRPRVNRNVQKYGLTPVAMTMTTQIWKSAFLERKVWMPHSTFLKPVQRPARSPSPLPVWRVQVMQPIER